MRLKAGLLALGTGTQEVLSHVWEGHANEFKARAFGFLDFATQADTGFSSGPRGWGTEVGDYGGFSLLGGAVKRLRDTGKRVDRDKHKREAGQSLILRSRLLCRPGLTKGVERGAPLRADLLC